MSQHSSTHVPKYAAAGHECRTSKGCKNARVLSISILFSHKYSGQLGEYVYRKKIFGVSCILRKGKSDLHVNRVILQTRGKGLIYGRCFYKYLLFKLRVVNFAPFSS